MRVGIIGTGYVGLVTGACLAHLGQSVTCIDKDSERIATLTRGTTPIHEEGLDDLLVEGVANGRLRFADDLTCLVDADISMICVGTPSGPDGIDLSALRQASAGIGQVLRGQNRYHVVVVKSTVVPGTTDQVVRTELEAASGRVVGHTLGLAMNPEFLSQGSAVRDNLNPDRLIIGAWDARSGDTLATMYRDYSAPMLRMSLRNAEMCKYAANAFQATLISFANQIASICEHIPGADHEAVLESVHLDRILQPEGRPAGAIRFLKGGIGFGGSCFPKDLAALQHFAGEIGAPSEMIDAVLATNRRRPDDVIARLEQILGGLEGRTISILGLAFKPGTDDVRESPGIALAERLLARKAVVRTHDPLAATRQRARAAMSTGIAIANTVEAALTDADAVILATAWPDYRTCDWAALSRRMKQALIYDGRNLLNGIVLPQGTSLIRVGTGPNRAKCEIGAVS